MTDTSDGATSPKLSVWMRPDGIVQVAWQPGPRIRFTDVVALADAVDTLMDGRRRPLLVDARGSTHALDRASRVELGRRDEFVSAIAVIVDTPLGRMSGNLFIALGSRRPPCDSSATRPAPSPGWARSRRERRGGRRRVDGTASGACPSSRSCHGGTGGVRPGPSPPATRVMPPSTADGRLRDSPGRRVGST